MGLTNCSVGTNAVDQGLVIHRKKTSDKVIALAGNPNVGQSTIFNGLTGMNQHTGNWPGKTVANAQGFCRTAKHDYIFVDIPGTYSLLAHSAEEEVARNFLCFAQPDAVIVVCDATCLERNLNLVLQTMEICSKVIVCVNLLDEAERKHIQINFPLLQKKLGVPVIGITAREQNHLMRLLTQLDQMVDSPSQKATSPVVYPQEITEAVRALSPWVEQAFGENYCNDWLAMALLEGDETLLAEIWQHCTPDDEVRQNMEDCLAESRKKLAAQGLTQEDLRDRIVTALVHTAEEICQGVVSYPATQAHSFDRKMDRILTSKSTGYPVMLLLLALIFWLTIEGANYPSQLLSEGLFWLQDQLTLLFTHLNAPDWLHGALVLGVYRVVAWVVSVMLPPMAIFFPLFTLLEDSGYLPRVAYNLDRPFQRCHACGKQALTMSMGFGCNAAGIVGCRIIDSPRERLLAILTNNFVPCNGRFPILITIITMFFLGTARGPFSGIFSACLLTLLILLGVGMTLLVTKFLSTTILKGVPSSFLLELPPYRKPQIGKVIVRYVVDRTLFVLVRAVLAAAPAGLLIWVMANVQIAGNSLLNHCATFLDPFATIMGLDGVILLGFILGFPANEIVIPIVIMAYLSQGTLVDLGNIETMKTLFVAQGWTWVTAGSMLLFTLFHWPCATSLLVIKKETGSWKWSALAFLIPTVVGVVLCSAFSCIAGLFL